MNGSWGIYLFRHGDYFALSNSFFRLLDHVKFKYPLTVNQDFCHHIVLEDVSSHAYSDTAVNEIQLVERNAVINIDITRKSLELELIDYKEQTLALDSAEGMTALDSWSEFWGNLLQNLIQRTEFVQADLSGGFDSRVAFTTVLNSGIDLNKIKIYTMLPSKVHTYAEDYEIANKIATHYGSRLNKPLPEAQALNYSLNDMWNLAFYDSQTFSRPTNHLIMNPYKKVSKLYTFNGYGGEAIRGHWNGSISDFIKKDSHRTFLYPHALSAQLFRSIKNILETAFVAICNKYRIDEQDGMRYFHYDTGCRSHFGKFTLSRYFKNNIMLSPIIDPILRTLKLSTPDCPDPKLLIAIIYTRYVQDLLTFPFDRKHSIAPETIAYAQRLNERFPRHMTTDKVDRGEFHLQPRDLHAEQILSSGRNNPTMPVGLLNKCLKAAFSSSKTYGLFTSYFDEEIYRHGERLYSSGQYGSHSGVYSILGITKALEAVEISKHNHSPYQDVKYLLAQDFATIHDDKQIPDNFKPYLTARVTLKLLTKEGDFQILSFSDDKAKVSQPSWQQTDGIGYLVFSLIGSLKIIAKASVDGKFRLTLGGMRVVNPEDKSKNVPYWIDYTALTVNDKTLLDTITPAWHSKPYIYNMEVKAGEEITIKVEWQPHRSDT